MVEHERTPGVGMLAGWRGANGDKAGVGEPNPDQLERYKANGCFWQAHIPDAGLFYKMANRDYLQWAKQHGFVGDVKPIVLELYSETMQKFRLAAQGHGALQPPQSERERVAKFFDPLPIYYGPADVVPIPDEADFPLSAITQRPMFMYHSWGSQNAWLRQIAARNFLYIHPDTAAEHGIVDDDLVFVESAHGKIRVPARLHAGTAPGTVWTWNAIGKRSDAWKLSKDAPEYTKGFLLNHVIDDLMPPRRDGYRYSNADPVTGQAAWFDLRVRIYPAQRYEAGESA
jgi:anaerobic selenocysteine-containing dehydrogenase